MFRSSAISTIYLIIGLVVAYSHGYLAGLTTISNLVSALLAIIAWPLLLIGVNLHIVL
jgi:uncharacterized membrane protein YhdT